MRLARGGILLLGLALFLIACDTLNPDLGSANPGAGREITDVRDGDDPPDARAPTEPADPGSPEEPTDPETPVEPTEPPSEPTNPDLPADPDLPAEPDPDPGVPTVATRLLAAVNSARAAGATCGGVWQAPVAPLTQNELLVQAAQGHSDDMLAHGSMSHTGSDGSGPGDRISRTGYRASWWGENVAWNYRSVEQVMAGWLGSAGHCTNIMNPNFTEFGAGEAGYYWTQVFARPR